jgi:hypothetical protein
MNNEKEIQTAWTVWQLMAKLNELIWNRYENEFIEQYLELEEEKYQESQLEKNL